MTDNVITIPKFNTIGTNVKVSTHLDEPQVVKLYEEPKKQAAKEAKAEPIAEAVEASQPAPQETPAQEPVKEEALSRRDALRRASERERKVMELEKQVKEKLAKAEEFQKFYEQAKEDPSLIAKAFGMETGEFLRKMQNKVLDLKEDAKPQAKKTEPVSATQERVNVLEQQTQRLAQAQFEATKMAYVNQNILPILTQDPEKFACLHENLPAYSSYIYDLINQNWLETGGQNGGEVLEPAKVAQALEEQLTKEAEEKALALKKNPKLKKHFREEAEQAPAPKAPVKTITNSLGAQASGGLPSNLPTHNTTGAKILYTDNMDPKSRRRLETAAKIREMFPEQFSKKKTV